MDQRDYYGQYGEFADYPPGTKFNETLMRFEIPLENDDGEEEILYLPAEFDVCPVCDGKGTHVNPSIDAHGITADEFSDDPDFRDEYFSGRYDVPCYACKTKRVYPQPNAKTDEEKEILARVDEWMEDEYHYRSICAAERRMGA